MESLLTKLYSRCAVADSEVATESSGSNRKAEAAVNVPNWPGCQQKPSKPRSVEIDEGVSLHHSETPPTRSMDAVPDSSDIRLKITVLQCQSSRESLAQPGVLNSPPDNVADAITQCQGSQSELESGDTTASGSPFVGQSSSGGNEGDMLLSRQELESFELLDVSEFENDNSSESLPPSPQPVPQSTSPRQATETTTAATTTGSSAFQFNQSKFITIRVMC